MGIKYNDNGTFKDIKVKVGDNIPVGAEFDYDGSTIPVGWEEITNPDSYSTSEVKTNKTWINGKPIYRKVITGTISATTTYLSIISNIEEVVYVIGTLEKSNYITNMPHYTSATNYSQLVVNTSNGMPILVTPAEQNGSTYKIYVEYTKTTD